MHTQRTRSDSGLSASSKGSAKKPTHKERKGLHQTPDRRTTDETNDPKMQVLVWDRGGDKKLKMPIGELYDKVGAENVKEERIPKKGRVSFEGAIIHLPMLLRVQRIFGQWQTLYVVSSS